MSTPSTPSPSVAPAAAAALHAITRLWPWNPDGEGVPALLTNPELIDRIFLKGSPLWALRTQMLAAAGIQGKPDAETLVRAVRMVWGDPVRRAAWCESQALEVAKLGPVGAYQPLVVIFATTMSGSTSGNDTDALVASLNNFTRWLEGLSSCGEEKVNHARPQDAEYSRWSFAILAILLAIQSRPKAWQALREAALRAPKLLPLLLPSDLACTPAELLALPAPRPAPTRLDAAWRKELESLGELERAIAEAGAAEAAFSASCKALTSPDAATLRELTASRERLDRVRADLAASLARICPAPGTPTPADAAPHIAKRRRELEEKTARLLGTAQAARELLGMIRPPHRLTQPVGGQVFHWLQEQVMQCVDAAADGTPVLRVAADDPTLAELRLIRMAMEGIGSAPGALQSAVSGRDVLLLARAGAFAPAPPPPLPPALVAQLHRQNGEIEELADAREGLQAALADAQQRIRELEWQLKAARGGRKGEGEGTGESADAVPRVFASVREAVEAARARFRDDLVFLDSAVESAAQSPYQNPALVHDRLESLARLARLWREKKGSLGKGFRDALADLGAPDYRGRISATAEGKFGEEYLFFWKGEKRVFGEHFTLGSKDANGCCSIHFFSDGDAFQIVVGHVGRHLTNTKS